MYFGNLLVHTISIIYPFILLPDLGVDNWAIPTCSALRGLLRLRDLGFPVAG